VAGRDVVGRDPLDPVLCGLVGDDSRRLSNADDPIPAGHGSCRGQLLASLVQPIPDLAGIRVAGFGSSTHPQMDDLAASCMLIAFSIVRGTLRFYRTLAAQRRLPS
jgi:hypothetical protein